MAGKAGSSLETLRELGLSDQQIQTLPRYKEISVSDLARLKAFPAGLYVASSLSREGWTVTTKSEREGSVIGRYRLDMNATRELNGVSVDLRYTIGHTLSGRMERDLISTQGASRADFKFTKSGRPVAVASYHPTVIHDIPDQVHRVAKAGTVKYLASRFETGYNNPKVIRL